MAMKFTINKAAFDALSAEMKAEYSVGDTEGEYVLDVSGLPAAEDVGPIKRALEKVKGEVKTLKADKDTLQAQIDAAPDVAALTKKHETEMGKLKTFTEKTLIDGTANTIATKISTVPALMSKELKGRMEVDLTGDEPVLRFKGADGKVDPNLTAEKLSAEYVANKDFSTIIIGSKASGGGAPKPTIKPQGGGAPLVGEQGQGDKPFNWATASAQEIAAKIGADKAAKAEAESAT